MKAPDSGQRGRKKSVVEGERGRKKIFLWSKIQWVAQRSFPFSISFFCVYIKILGLWCGGGTCIHGLYILGGEKNYEGGGNGCTEIRGWRPSQFGPTISVSYVCCTILCRAGFHVALAVPPAKRCSIWGRGLCESVEIVLAYIPCCFSH